MGQNPAVPHHNPGRDGRCRPPPGQIRTCALTHTAPPSGQTAPTRCRSRVARVTPNAGAVSRQCRASPASPPVRPFAPSTPPRVSTPLCSPPSSLLWPDLIARPRASTDYGIALSRCGPGVATRRDKAEPSQVPVLDVQACVSSLTPQSPTTARQKRRRRCCLRPMGKPRHSRLCIFSVLNSSAHLPRCRRFTARLATSRARLAELRGVACSFAVEDLHLLPKHQLAWRTPLYVAITTRDTSRLLKKRLPGSRSGERRLEAASGFVMVAS